MRIFVSSSFEDLKEHRNAAIRVLRQLRHEVLAMEDLVAGTAAPLAKVLEMVDRSEVYVGIFAWRYGYIPQAAPPDPPQKPTKEIPTVPGATLGQTSITHYEYLRAVQRKLPILAFLLDENHPWSPGLIDGIDKTRVNAPVNADNIRALRQSLQQERIVSWFTTPSDLEARVGAAVTMAGLRRQLDLKQATALPPNSGSPTDSSPVGGITQAISSAGDRQQVFKIDLATTWWSTRLYLVAFLAQRLTNARRIIIVDSTKTTPEEHFIGQLSTNAIISTIGPKLPALQRFKQVMTTRPMEYNDVSTEMNGILDDWYAAFSDQLGAHAHEEKAKADINPELLGRWFGDAMLKQPVHIADMRRASAVDLLRLLDYPNDFIPVFKSIEPKSEGQAQTERVDVVDKNGLNSRIARNYIRELLDQERIL